MPIYKIKNAIKIVPTPKTDLQGNFVYNFYPYSKPRPEKITLNKYINMEIKSDSPYNAGYYFLDYVLRDCDSVNYFTIESKQYHNFKVKNLYKISKVSGY